LVESKRRLLIFSDGGGYATYGNHDTDCYDPEKTLVDVLDGYTPILSIAEYGTPEQRVHGQRNKQSI